MILGRRKKGGETLLLEGGAVRCARKTLGIPVPPSRERQEKNCPTRGEGRILSCDA